MSNDTDDVSDTTEQVLAEIEPGSLIADKVILSKPQVAAVLGGSATLAGVIGFGGGTASAQEAAGQLGAPDDEIEAFLNNYGSESTTSGYEITLEGDTFQINE